MSIRLDPRRVNALKHLAGQAGVRPGDLVRGWVEERIDGARGAEPVAGTPAAGGASVLERLDALASRVDALEAARNGVSDAPPAATSEPSEFGEPSRSAEPAAQADPMPQPDGAQAEGAAQAESTETDADEQVAAPIAKRVAATPSSGRVALHDEMIAVIREQGPQTAADLAAAIVERGRYTVPRSGKPLDAKTVSQRVSNPTYRSRFLRREGRIGLAEQP